MAKRKHISRPDHPLAPPSGLLLVSRVVLYEKLGAGSHPCHWCQRVLPWAKSTKKGRRGNSKGCIIADHLDGNPLNDDPANLVPACNGCNVSRGHSEILPTDQFVVISGIRNRADKMTCEECKQDFLISKSQRKTRLGRFCSRSCRNKTVARESGKGIAPGELFIEIHLKTRVKRMRAVKKNCLQCDGEFIVTLQLAEIRQCCSRDCAYKLRKTRNKVKPGSERTADPSPDVSG